MDKKKLIITVDTEGDNLWEWKKGDKITVENAKYIIDFQTLCERYGFRPVYLINYEMAQSDFLVDFLVDKRKNDACEIGMHMHAWNSPPYWDIQDVYGGCSYITEYPEEIIREKHKFLAGLIEERFGVRPVTYRSGRWATNDSLFKVLDELGFLVDCSIAPGVDFSQNKGMSVSKGNNYRCEQYKIRRLCGNLIEVPMTSCFNRSFSGKNLKCKLSHLIKGEELWMRPATNTYSGMVRLLKIIEKENSRYIDFMVHSSELMPGCSPYCKNERELRQFHNRMESFFEFIINNNYEGITMQQFYSQIHL